MREKGAIREVPQRSEQFVSNLFLVPKKDGSRRPVFNLKALNAFVTLHKFRLENLGTVRTLIQPRDFLIKIDLKDAYFSLPIHADDRKYLVFQWEEKLYEFKCLPFGLSSAPYIFTKALKPVMAHLRRQGLRVVIYLDDLLIMHQDYNALASLAQEIIELSTALGFSINFDKSSLTPSYLIEYLGVEIDSYSFLFRLPENKVKKLEMKCKELLKKPRVTVREASSLIGDCVWAVSSVPYAQAHYRHLQGQTLRSQSLSPGSFEGEVILNADARAELSWWVSDLPRNNGKTIEDSDPDLLIFSDASLTGWGAFCEGVEANGPWSILMSWSCEQQTTHFSRGLRVHLCLDNATAVAYINKAGGTRSLQLYHLAQQIIAYCESRSLTLSASHVAGKSYAIADTLSRALNDSSDWRLDPTAFKVIARRWDMDFDLFAKEWNRQLVRFASCTPQPRATATNAFSLNWASCKPYLFPPFALIAKCLTKVIREAEEVVLVAPLWPQQPWYPLLLQIACEEPLILLDYIFLLTSANGKPHPLLQAGSLRLAAWRLSGRPYASRGSRTEPSNCYNAGLGPSRSKHMTQPGDRGQTGAARQAPTLSRTTLRK